MEVMVYLTSSLRYGIMVVMISGNICIICLWQPSPQDEIAISAACLNFQLVDCSMVGTLVKMWGNMVLPPRLQAKRSRALSPATLFLIGGCSVDIEVLINVVDKWRG